MEDQLFRDYKDVKIGDTYALETYRIYFSTFHGKRMINGYSGYLPDSYNRLSENLENFPSEGSIKALSDIGVTHVIVHLAQYNREKQADIMKRLEAESARLDRVFNTQDDFVYKIHKK
jgi:hypothetical protein